MLNGEGENQSIIDQIESQFHKLNYHDDNDGMVVSEDMVDEHTVADASSAEFPPQSADVSIAFPETETDEDEGDHDHTSVYPDDDGEIASENEMALATDAETTASVASDDVLDQASAAVFDSENTITHSDDTAEGEDDSPEGVVPVESSAQSDVSDGDTISEDENGSEEVPVPQNAMFSDGSPEDENSSLNAERVFDNPELQDASEPPATFEHEHDSQEAAKLDDSSDIRDSVIDRENRVDYDPDGDAIYECEDTDDVLDGATQEPQSADYDEMSLNEFANVEYVRNETDFHHSIDANDDDIVDDQSMDFDTEDSAHDDKWQLANVDNIEHHETSSDTYEGHTYDKASPIEFDDVPISEYQNLSNQNQAEFSDESTEESEQNSDNIQEVLSDNSEITSDEYKDEIREEDFVQTEKNHVEDYTLQEYIGSLYTESIEELGYFTEDDDSNLASQDNEPFDNLPAASQDELVEAKDSVYVESMRAIEDENDNDISFSTESLISHEDNDRNEPELSESILSEENEINSDSQILEDLIGQVDQTISEVYKVKDSTSIRQSLIMGTNVSQRYLLFTVGNTCYAATVSNILEIGRVPTVTPVPNVPGWLPGLINLRGEILSVIDLRHFLGFDESLKNDENRLLVVKTEDDEIMTSLVVDQVNGFIQLDATQKGQSSLSSDDKVAPYLDGIYEHEGTIIAIMDIERILQSPEVVQFG